MKKILIGIILIICVLSVGCGAKEAKPDNISEDTYNKAIKAITIFDSYKNGEMDSEMFLKELYSIGIESKLLEKKDGKWTYDSAEISDDDAKVYCAIVDMGMNFPSPYLELSQEQTEHLEEVVTKTRNELAEMINYRD